MKYLALVLIATLAMYGSLSQKVDQYQACSEKAKTQTEMHACANDEVKRADVELNQTYAMLLSKAKNDSRKTAKIRAAERAWILYRDTYIDAMYPAENKQAEYGSAYPTEVDLLRAKLTRQQIAAVQVLLEQYSH